MFQNIWVHWSRSHCIYFSNVFFCFSWTQLSTGSSHKEKFSRFPFVVCFLSEKISSSRENPPTKCPVVPCLWLRPLEPPPSECVAGWTAMTCSWELWTVKLCSFYRRLVSPVGGRHQWVCYTMSPQHAMSQQVIAVQSQPLNSTTSNYCNEELQMQRNVFAFETLTFPLSLFLFSLFWLLFWKEKHVADGFFESSKWREAPAANGERRR